MITTKITFTSKTTEIAVVVTLVVLVLTTGVVQGVDIIVAVIEVVAILIEEVVAVIGEIIPTIIIETDHLIAGKVISILYFENSVENF